MFPGTVPRANPFSNKDSVLWCNQCVAPGGLHVSAISCLTNCVGFDFRRTGPKAKTDGAGIVLCRRRGTPTNGAGAGQGSCQTDICLQSGFREQEFHSALGSFPRARGPGST